MLRRVPHGYGGAGPQAMRRSRGSPLADIPCSMMQLSATASTFRVHRDELSPLHIVGECLCIIGMPAREGWTVLDDVTGRPKNASLIQGPGRIIVWTQYVKIPNRQALQHKIDGLFWRPCARRLLGAAFGGQLREDETGNQQMRAESAAGRVPQFVLKRFGENPHASLGHIVGRVTGRGGNPLLGPSVNDQARTPAIDHAGREHLRTVDHAPQVDDKDSFPTRGRTEDEAYWLDA